MLAYLKQRREAAARVHAEIEAKPEYQALRERLLAIPNEVFEGPAGQPVFPIS